MLRKESHLRLRNPATLQRDRATFDSPKLKIGRKIEHQRLSSDFRRVAERRVALPPSFVQGADFMPDDLKECRRHAARCAELAMAAHSTLRAVFLELSKNWELRSNQKNAFAELAESEDIRSRFSTMTNDIEDTAKLEMRLCALEAMTANLFAVMALMVPGINPDQLITRARSQMIAGAQGKTLPEVRDPALSQLLEAAIDRLLGMVSEQITLLQQDQLENAPGQEFCIDTHISSP